MKKRFKAIIAVLLALSISAFVLAACSGDTNADKIDSSELGGYDYSQEAAFGEVPDENVRIDGVLDEDLWKTLPLIFRKKDFISALTPMTKKSIGTVKTIITGTLISFSE